MSNKFGKFLLAGAAIGSAIGTTLYLMKKKKNVTETPEEYEDADYDDFSEDLEDTPEKSVEEPQTESAPFTKATIDGTFNKVAEKLTAFAEKTTEKMENFTEKASEKAEQFAEKASEKVDSFMEKAVQKVDTFYGSAETTKEPEAVDEPEIIEEPEVIEEPEIIDEPEVIAEPEIIEEPEVIAEPEIIDEPEVIAEPEIIEEPQVTEEPLIEEEPNFVPLNEQMEMEESVEEFCFDDDEDETV